LISNGEQSIKDGFEVVVIVEELDIEDIQKMKEETHKPDILKVLGNLLEGSCNHLDAFNKQLDSL